MISYREKNVAPIVEAIQFTGNNTQEIWDKFGASSVYGQTEKNLHSLIITGASGEYVEVQVGDWVIRSGGSVYMCTKQGFEDAYEEINE